MICLLLLRFIFPSLSHADSQLHDDKSVLQFLQEAYQAQLSLGNKLQSMEEIHKTLYPYFTKDYTREFLDENLVDEIGKYITYGTDFPIYYIPFFSYTNETKVVRSQDSIYVFEFFPETNEGPVSYESHYEGVRMERADTVWKVAEYLNNEILLEIIDQSKGDGTPVKRDLANKSVAKVTLQIGLALNPITSFYKYGNSFVVDHFE